MPQYNDGPMPYRGSEPHARMDVISEQIGRLRADLSKLAADYDELNRYVRSGAAKFVAGRGEVSITATGNSSVQGITVGGKRVPDKLSDIIPFQKHNRCVKCSYESSGYSWGTYQKSTWWGRPERLRFDCVQCGATWYTKPALTHE